MPYALCLMSYACDEDADAALSFEIKVLMPYALCLCLMSYACDEDADAALNFEIKVLDQQGAIWPINCLRSHVLVA
jgi:hypothetical protein